jgi:hypothetical protein
MPVTSTVLQGFTDRTAMLLKIQVFFFTCYTV